jgi:hypothetical protein
MEERFCQAFQDMGRKDPPFGLEGRILKRIDEERIRAAGRKLVLVRSGLLLSAILFISALSTQWSGFAQSDFWSLASLLFLDAGIVLAHGGEFLLSLLETFPTVPAVMTLLPALFLAFLFRTYAETQSKGRLLIR